MMHWYVFTTPAQKEFLANKVFCKQGFHNFTVRIGDIGPDKGKLIKPALNQKEPNVVVPTVIKNSRVRGKRNRRQRVYASVPSYIVFAFPEGSDVPWGTFNRFRPNLLSRVVGIDGKAIKFTDAQIEPWLKKSGQSFNFETVPNPHQAFNIGEQVRVAAGPYQGQEFPIEDIRGVRARGLIQALGGPTPIEIPLEYLESAA